MRKIFFSFFLILITGCSTVSKINEDYQSINFSDGINPREAVSIAQKEVIKRVMQKKYEILHPQVYDSQGIQEWIFRNDYQYFNKQLSSDRPKYAASWFVLFQPPPFTAYSHFLVVVDKNSGEIHLTYTFDPWAPVQDLFSVFSNPEKFTKSIVETKPLLAAVAYHQEKKLWPADAAELEKYFISKTSQPEAPVTLDDFQDLKFYQDKQARPVIEFKDKEKNFRRFIITKSDWTKKTYHVIDDLSNTPLHFNMTFALKLTGGDKVLIDQIDYAIDNNNVDGGMNSLPGNTPTNRGEGL